MALPEVIGTDSQSQAVTPKKSVLIIDDSIDILELLRTVLEVDDYEIFSAANGQEAFRVLSEINKPDLILLDVQMDIMTGPEFLIMLEENMPEIVDQVPVVFLTAMDEVPKVSRAAGCIRKPIDVDNFLKDMRRFMEQGPGRRHLGH